MKHMTWLAGRFVAIGLLVGAALTAQAQGTPNPPIPIITFAIPIAVDPVKLFLNEPGVAYTSTNDPNSTTNAAITGATLLPVTSGGLGGMEIHGGLSRRGLITPVPEIDFQLSYLDPVDFLSVSDPQTANRSGNPYTPWLVTDMGIQNSKHKFVLTPQTGSAPMDESSFYGVLSAELPAGTDPAAASAFRLAGFSTTGFTPEPGAGLLLLGGVAALGLLKTRRRKNAKSGRERLID